tara:strand:+ start:767 stop:1066 length:300 start_codon:yes stop_codon:yes gene_type:complete
MTRFTEVAPPFDQRVTNSVLHHIHDAIALGADTHSRLRCATKNATYNSHVAQTITESLSFGTMPFCFFACALVMFVVYQVIIQREAKQLLTAFELKKLD